MTREVIKNEPMHGNQNAQTMIPECTNNDFQPNIMNEIRQCLL